MASEVENNAPRIVSVPQMLGMFLVITHCLSALSLFLFGFVFTGTSNFQG